MSIINDLRDRINNHLQPLIDPYLESLQPIAQRKVVRDVIWGFNLYEPFELALIDSPPFQRLRNIHQTSLAFFTYPCSIHSRFEHSLGAASVASRMLDAIERRKPTFIDPTLRIETRIAALLHDLSHGPFSHSSESFYGHLLDEDKRSVFEKAREEDPNLFAEANASEILTYLMLTTDSFIKMWGHIVEMYRRQTPKLDEVKFRRSASMLLGVDTALDGAPRFYRQIVNGPFDADKLDYLPRDGYFTGLEIIVDIERLLHTISVCKQNGEADISVVATGATVLEQVIFAKTQLYSSVYHHHKVRAAHRMLHQLLHTMTALRHTIGGHELKDPVTYSIIDDNDLLQSYHGVPELDAIVSKIKSRILPKRALIISYPCFESDDAESRENFNRIDDASARVIEQKIRDECDIPDGSVFLDLPTPPSVFGTGQALVEIDRTGERTLLLQDIYPAGAWAKAYSGYRKVAYIFTTDPDRKKVGLAAQKVLSNLDYPVRLNENALALAKVI